MKPCKSVQMTMGSGAGPKWPAGSKTRLGVGWIHAEAGTTCSAWDIPHAFLVPSMPRPIQRPSRLLKKLPQEVQAIQQAHAQAKIELWSSDEHRIGLKPILRRVWARKGGRGKAIVAPRYQWMYLYGFAQPESGKTSWLLMPTVNTEAFSLA